jgi:hypothetical protein
MDLTLWILNQKIHIILKRAVANRGILYYGSMKFGTLHLVII